MVKNKIIFFGTSSFAVPALEALVNNGYEISAVVTVPDELVGRKQILTPPPIKITAEKFGLKVSQPKKLEIGNWKLEIPDASVGVVASYGKIIPAEIIGSFKLGVLNIHPSLLPKYRGPSPIQYALLNGDKKTGATIMKIDDQVDHGPILNIVSYILQVTSKFVDVHSNLAKIGAELLIKTLPDYISGKVKPIEQDHSQATFTKIIKKEDGKIDWNKSAGQIYNRFRAFHLWPGIWTTYQNKTLKIADCESYESKTKNEVGVVFENDKDILITCGSNALKLNRLQLEGRKEMSVRDFFAGRKDLIGSKLG